MIGATETCEPEGGKSNPQRVSAFARVGWQDGFLPLEI